ncbi:MAG: hypothetical protein RSB82_02305 [Victivallaceae bacterium]
MKHDYCDGIRLDKEVFYYKGLDFQSATIPSWERLIIDIPLLTKGWYELILLDDSDRTALIKDIWLNCFTLFDIHKEILGIIDDFFNCLDSICIYAFKTEMNVFSDLRMVYSLKGGNGFFQGGPPFSGDIEAFFQKRFNQTFSPEYRAFFLLHDGFSLNDDGGIVSTKNLSRTYQRVRNRLISDSSSYSFFAEDGFGLFPFYESVGLNEYQCFLSDPEIVMGMGDASICVLDNDLNQVIEILNGNRKFDESDGCHYRFLDWLTCYLKKGWR